MFTFDAKGDESRFAKDMVRVASQLNDMSPEKAASWMAERQRWMRRNGDFDTPEEFVAHLKWTAFDIATALNQLNAWENQARELTQVAA